MSYNLTGFGSGLIGQLAQQIDRNSYEGKEGKLDGKEISLFANELSNKGITFDFSKINDSDYINSVEEQYKNSLDNVYKQNNRAEEIIEKHKENYDIRKIYNQNSDGSFTACYEITAKVDVNLAKLKNDLKIPKGVISTCNNGYDQWDNNSHYIDNKAMKDITIKIPADKLGAETDLIDLIIDFFQSIKF